MIYQRSPSNPNLV